MRFILFFTLLSLAACGADGAPETPGTAPGATISGDAQVGVVIGN